VYIPFPANRLGSNGTAAPNAPFCCAKIGEAIGEMSGETMGDTKGVGVGLTTILIGITVCGIIRLACNTVGNIGLLIHGGNGLGHLGSQLNQQSP